MKNSDHIQMKRKRKLPPDKIGSTEEAASKKPKMSKKMQMELEELEMKKDLKLFSMPQLVLLARHFFEKTPLSARALTNRTRITNSIVGLERRNEKVIHFEVGNQFQRLTKNSYLTFAGEKPNHRSLRKIKGVFRQC